MMSPLGSSSAPSSPYDREHPNQLKMPYATRAATTALSTTLKRTATQTFSQTVLPPSKRQKSSAATCEKPSSTSISSSFSTTKKNTVSTSTRKAKGIPALNNTEHKVERLRPGSPTLSDVFQRPPPAPPVASPSETVLPPTLSFSLPDAKAHLIAQDPRFQALFSLHSIKPYELPLQPINAFRSLVTSLLGQQISWLAARSIQHKFVRLFFSSDMPDKWEEGGEETWGKLFPSPAQILALGGTELEAIATMRTAGLSGRKAEYTYLLAQHFSSGHLSSSKLLSLPDADCRKLLTDIRGIGPWTADMFSLFSLRRPDVLPVGDLGVQKGLVKWLLADPEVVEGKKTEVADGAMSVKVLREREKGTKVKGGGYLTAREMEALTEGWKPYRSIGSWLMWKVLGEVEN
jgi:DNA-3-methyladenine glycosylase II